MKHFVGSTFLGLWMMSVSTGSAQTSVQLPPALVPIIRQIESQATPAQLTQMVQKASPTAWRLIEDKSRLAQTGKLPAFTQDDWTRIPKVEQNALIQTFQPLVTQALSRLTLAQQMDLMRTVGATDAASLVVPVLNAVRVMPGAGAIPGR
jgi:hypothetical protein